jgi:hypothetical protein
MSSSIEIEKKMEELRKWKTKISVADPGCLSRTPDPIFSSQIPNPE